MIVNITDNRPIESFASQIIKHLVVIINDDWSDMKIVQLYSGFIFSLSDLIVWQINLVDDKIKYNNPYRANLKK